MVLLLDEGEIETPDEVLGHLPRFPAADIGQPIGLFLEQSCDPALANGDSAVLEAGIERFGDLATAIVGHEDFEA